MSVFIDACVLISFANPDDTCHARAKKIIGEILDLKFGKAYTSDYVFDETVTVMLQKTKDVAMTTDFGEKILKGEVELLKVDESVFKDAWKIFRHQHAPGLSFTDCTNLALMDTYNIRRIATFDQAFKKAKNAEVIC